MQGDIVYISVFAYLFDMHLSKIKFSPENVYKVGFLVLVIVQSTRKNILNVEQGIAV